MVRNYLGDKDIKVSLKIDLINRIYQDATVGTLAIDKILKKTNNEDTNVIYNTITIILCDYLFMMIL